MERETIFLQAVGNPTLQSGLCRLQLALGSIHAPFKDFLRSEQFQILISPLQFSKQEFPAKFILGLALPYE